MLALVIVFFRSNFEFLIKFVDRVAIWGDISLHQFGLLPRSWCIKKVSENVHFWDGPALSSLKLKKFNSMNWEIVKIWKLSPSLHYQHRSATILPEILLHYFVSPISTLLAFHKVLPHNHSIYQKGICKNFIFWKALFYLKIQSSFFHINPKNLAKLI